MLRTYFTFKGQHLKTQMEYVFNFWMLVFSGVLTRTLLMGVAFVLFRTMPTIAGWQESEVYLIMSFMILTEGVCNLFLDGVWAVPSMVFGGEFDVILSRPVSPLFQVVGHEISLQGIGSMALGTVVMVLSLRAMGWLSLGTILLCVLFVGAGAAFRFSTNLIGASIIFYIGPTPQTNVMFMLYSLGEYGKYPVNIYPAWMRFVLFVFIPTAFIGYVPALILRGQTPLLWLGLLLGFCGVYFMAARAFFYHGIKKYESMGM